MNKIMPNAQPWWALLGICLLAFFLFLDFGIVSKSLTAIKKKFHATNVQVQWLISAFMLALCVFMVIMGRLGDLFGLRKIFYINIVLFSLSSLGAGLASNIHILIVMRALQGITAASAPISAALATHNFPVPQRAKAISIFSMITGSGLALGPVLGGFIIDTIGWRWIFFINIPIALIGLMICNKTVIEAEKPAQRESFDSVGAILLAVGLTSLVLGLMQGSSWGWSSTATWITFILAIMTLPAFIIVEFYKQHPLINFHLFNHRIFIAAAITCVVFGLFMATLLFLNPLYLQNILGLNVSLAGLLLLIISGMVVLIGPIAGWITHRYGSVVGTMLVLILTAVSACLHIFFNDHLQLAFIIPAFITFGMAWGFLNIAPVLAVTEIVDHENTGVIMGALWTFLNLGTSVGPAIMGMIFRSSSAFMPGFHLTTLWLTVISTLAAISTLFFLRRQKDTHFFLRQG
jgi:EmrB/QacA subfamily drug resistance transporter